MIRNLLTVFLLLAVTSCATMAPNPTLVNKIDTYFKAAKSDSYEASEKYQQPIPYEVGQYIVTGMTHGSERSVQKMALVGKEDNGWIIETHTITPHDEITTQMMVEGMETVQETGNLDTLEIVWVKIKMEDDSVQTIDGKMMKMMQGMYRKGLSALESQITSSEDGGTVQVAAGIFNDTVKTNTEGSFMGKKHLANIWLHPSVPINGIVKSVHENDEMKIELLDFGLSGATSSF
jgi:hypothetical protein